MYLIVVQRIFFSVFFVIEFDVFVQMPRLLIAENGPIDTRCFLIVLYEIEILGFQRRRDRHGEFLHIVREMIQFHSFPEDASNLVMFRDFDGILILRSVHRIPLLENVVVVVAPTVDGDAIAPRVAFTYFVPQGVTNMIENHQLRIEVTQLRIVF